jgi:hypothetical protein
MKTGHILLVTGLIVAAAGVWFGRQMWAAHHGLVTLHVRNMPLAEAVRTIAKQINQQIRVDPRLDAKVTLDVTRVPLTQVLDSLADQAGARWGKTYAVYHSERSLGRLERVLKGASTLDAEGWTNLAPQYAKADMPMIPDLGDSGGGRRVVINGGPGSPNGQAISIQNEADMQKFLQEHLSGQDVSIQTNGDLQKTLQDLKKSGAFVVNSEYRTNTEDVNVTTAPGGVKKVVRMGGPGDIGAQPMRAVRVRVSKGPNGTTTTTTTLDGNGEQVSVTKSGADGVIEKQEDWSRERLVMETPLTDQLGSAIPTQANPETAAQTAQKVKGKYTTYYALEKPPIGGDFRIFGLPGLTRGKGGSNDPAGTADALLKQGMMGGLGSLTPEQQVQRARQMRAVEDTSK